MPMHINGLMSNAFFDKNINSKAYDVVWLNNLEKNIKDNIDNLSESQKKQLKEHISKVVPVMLLSFANSQRNDVYDEAKDDDLNAISIMLGMSMSNSSKNVCSIFSNMKDIIISTCKVFSHLGDNSLKETKSLLTYVQSKITDDYTESEYSCSISFKKIYLKSMIYDFLKNVQDVKDLDSPLINLNGETFNDYYVGLINENYYNVCNFFMTLGNELKLVYDDYKDKSLRLFTVDMYNSGEALSDDKAYFSVLNKNKTDDMTVVLPMFVSRKTGDEFNVCVKSLLKSFKDDVRNFLLSSDEIDLAIQNFKLTKDLNESLTECVSIRIAKKKTTRKF